MSKFCKATFALGSVLIVADSSNLNSQCKNVEICKQGHNKSYSDKKIIAFSYAVRSFGLHIYSEIYTGGLVDAKEFQQNDIKGTGVILDRGYYT